MIREIHDAEIEEEIRDEFGLQKLMLLYQFKSSRIWNRNFHFFHNCSRDCSVINWHSTIQLCTKLLFLNITNYISCKFLWANLEKLFECSTKKETVTFRHKVRIQYVNICAENVWRKRSSQRMRVKWLILAWHNTSPLTRFTRRDLLTAFIRTYQRRLSSSSMALLLSLKLDQHTVFVKWIFLSEIGRNE